MSNHRRDFVHKRAHIAARAVPPDNPAVMPVPGPPSVAAADPKPTNSSNPLTPVIPEPTTSDAPSSSPTPASPTPPVASSPPSVSSPSANSVALSAASSKSSLAALTTPSTVATALTSPAKVTPYGPSVSTQIVGVSYTPSYSLSSTPSPSTTSPSGSSGGTSTGVIVAGVAGTLAGIAVLGFLLMWCMRRQRNKDIDDFDAQAFRRQSAVLLNDPVEPSRSYNPRPPTMIERHNASPALAAQAGYGSQNFYGSYGGYGQQPSYPPEMIQPAVSPPPQAHGAPPMGYAGYNDPQPQLGRQPSTMGHAAYDAQQPLARQPSSAAYLTRQPSGVAGYASAPPPPGSFDPNAQYIDLDRSSVSPYQAAQYADISRQLGTTDPNMEAPQPLDLPDTPLPSPFDDPVQATLPSHAHQVHSSGVTAPVSAATAAVPHTQNNVAESHERPSTVYEEGDAYGGI